MTMLTAFAAISACRFADVREPALRHDDSVDGSLLPVVEVEARVAARSQAHRSDGVAASRRRLLRDRTVARS